MTVPPPRIAPAYIPEAVARLREAAQPGAAHHAGPSWTARRVGRNDVWEVTRSGSVPERHFVKFWANPQVFRRELIGVRILADLAAKSDGLLAPHLVYVDEECGAMVSAEMRGTSIQAILADALKRTVRLSSRAERLQHAQTCIRRIVRFLEELHSVPVPDEPSLASHKPLDVIERINRLASRLSSQPRFRAHRALADLRVAATDVPLHPPSANCLIHGDPGPGNFLAAGSRLAVFDFEDLGVGPACRDFLWLEYSLEQFDAMWRYRSARRLMAALPECDVDARLRLLYRMEFHLIHLNAISLRPNSFSTWQRCRDCLEQRRVLHSLARHSIQFASAGVTSPPRHPRPRVLSEVADAF